MVFHDLILFKKSLIFDLSLTIKLFQLVVAWKIRNLEQSLTPIHVK